MGTIADSFEQRFTVSAYQELRRDDIDRKRELLWPGIGKPTSVLHKYLEMCQTAVRLNALPVPPIFHNCSGTLTDADSTEALQLYWEAVNHRMETHDLLAKLQRSTQLNPFVAEPYVLLAQVFFRVGSFDAARQAAETAMANMASWGSAWDKRLPLRVWLVFARVLRQKAVGKLELRPGGGLRRHWRAAGHQIALHEALGKVPLGRT